MPKGTPIAHLNAAQRVALSWLFSPDNHEGEPFNASPELYVSQGQVVVDGLYLHSNGDWATFPEARYQRAS